MVWCNMSTSGIKFRLRRWAKAMQASQKYITHRIIFKKKKLQTTSIFLWSSNIRTRQFSMELKVGKTEKESVFLQCTWTNYELIVYRNLWSKQLYKTENGILTKGSFHISINVMIQISYVMILNHIFQSLKDCLIRLKDLLDQDKIRKEDRLSYNCYSRVPAPSFEPCHVFQWWGQDTELNGL